LQATASEKQETPWSRVQSCMVAKNTVALEINCHILIIQCRHKWQTYLRYSRNIAKLASCCLKNVFLVRPWPFIQNWLSKKVAIHSTVGRPPG
jgi:hypothetical protein